MGFISHTTNTQVGNSKTGKTHSATLFLRIQVISASALLPSGRHQCLLPQSQTAAETPGIPCRHDHTASKTGAGGRLPSVNISSIARITAWLCMLLPPGRIRILSSWLGHITVAKSGHWERE